ncbi:MAG: hypothetical protein ABW061_29320 [Polyangiaceae bacterium]
MSRFLICSAVAGCLFAASAAGAQTTALLAASDASQITELKVAKVMADDTSIWLSVRLRGKAQLAVVTADAAVESAPGADAWLRALDFTTRVRVAAPPGPLVTCGLNQEVGLVDSGLPEPAVSSAERVQTADSELALRRALEDAGLHVDPEQIARFTHGVEAPFRVALYNLPESGGDTAALRLREHGNATTTPRIELVGRNAVPISLIALANAAVLPPTAESADPSEFPITYRAASSSSATSDYVNARGGWSLAHPERWLVEAQNSASLFAWTVFPARAELAPVASRYFQGLAGACAARSQTAHAQGSQRAADYQCGDYDDLAQVATELGFGQLRVSRLFGSLTADAIALRVVASEARSPLVDATDVDLQNCSAATVGTPPGLSTPEPRPPIVVSDPGPGAGDETNLGTPIYTDEGSCNLTIVSSDSCSGDSSSSDSSDSCSGDSSSSDSSDSCSGDSSSDDSGSDSCTGDSSSDSTNDSCSGDSNSGSDSSGCGKSDGYDGDTCSGNSHSSAQALQSSSAELRSDTTPRQHRPRRVHLSLLTLLAAALALPLRRLRSLRF